MADGAADGAGRGAGWAGRAQSPVSVPEAPHDLPGGTDVERLTSALAAERAASAHWRRLAEQRTEALDAMRTRGAVRAVLVLDRHTRRSRAAATRIAGGLATAGREVSRTLGAVADAGARRRRRADLHAGVAALGKAPDAPQVEVIDADLDPTEVGRRMAMADHGLVCLRSSAAEPVDGEWLARLASALGPEVAAAGPVLLHPDRGGLRAAPADLTVRDAGLRLRLDHDGAPILEPLGAGEPWRPSGARDVDALAPVCLVVDRAAVASCGGLAHAASGRGASLGEAVADLCVRLRGSGRRVVVVPEVPVVDRRPLDAGAPCGGQDALARWPGLLERHGAALRRAAAPSDDRLSFALTVAAPSAKVAARWGDTHLAEGLAAALRRSGCEARVGALDAADGPVARSRDVHVVLRGLEPVARTPGQRHVLWVISHPEAVDDRELDEADLVLVASTRFAAALRARTSTPVEVLLQATDAHRFRPCPPDPRHAHAVTVVARSRDVLRSAVADALAAGLRPAIYGSGWAQLVDPDLVVADHVPNEDLPTVYCSAGVVLSDHWDTMRAWGFVSNRLFDVLACGVPVISDDLPELDEIFDGTVPAYRSSEHLRELVEADLADPAQARRRAERGRALVLAGHTFDHRAAELLAAVRRHGVAEDASLPVANREPERTGPGAGNGGAAVVYRGATGSREGRCHS